MTTNSNQDVRWKIGERMSELVNAGLSIRQAAKRCGAPRSTAYDALTYYRETVEAITEKQGNGPNILFIDIETAPIIGHVWALFKQNVGINQIELDWYIMSYSAKWAHSNEIIYEDKRDHYWDEDDIELCKSMWTLLDKADIIVAHNGKAFDVKKMNTRFLLHDMPPPSFYSVVDTLNTAKKHFAFTSNKLAFLTDKLCRVYKKLDHGDFPGHDLWVQCLKGNMDAWQEMEDYNKYDVLSLEELYYRLLPWDNTHPNIELYFEDNLPRCRCGSCDLQWTGYTYTTVSKFDQFRCNDCGGTTRGRVNLLSKDKRDSLTSN